MQDAVASERYEQAAQLQSDLEADEAEAAAIEQAWGLSRPPSAPSTTTASTTGGNRARRAGSVGGGQRQAAGTAPDEASEAGSTPGLALTRASEAPGHEGGRGSREAGEPLPSVPRLAGPVGGYNGIDEHEASGSAALSSFASAAAALDAEGDAAASGRPWTPAGEVSHMQGPGQAQRQSQTQWQAQGQGQGHYRYNDSSGSQLPGQEAGGQPQEPVAGVDEDAAADHGWQRQGQEHAAPGSAPDGDLHDNPLFADLEVHEHRVTNDLDAVGAAGGSSGIVEGGGTEGGWQHGAAPSGGWQAYHNPVAEHDGGEEGQDAEGYGAQGFGLQGVHPTVYGR